MPRVASALVVAVVMVATGLALAGPAGAAPPPGGTYVPVAGSRVVDTRGSAPDTEVTIPPATLQTAGVPCGVNPAVSSVSAIVFSVSVLNPAKPGNLSDEVNVSGALGPGFMTFARGQTETVTDVDTNVFCSDDNTAAVELGSSTPVTWVIDVVGYFTSDTSTTASGLYRTVTPTRLVDTRAHPGTRLSAGQTRAIAVAGQAGVPATGVQSVVVNLTAVTPSNASYLIAYPAGATRPHVTSLNVLKNHNQANRLIVPIGTAGAIDIYNASASVDIVVDVVGYFTSGPDDSGAYFAPIGTPDQAHPDSIRRLVDSRPGNNIHAAWNTNAGATNKLTLPSNKPANVVAAMLTVSSIVPTSPTGYWIVYPSATSRPHTSDLSTTRGYSVNNLAPAGTAVDGTISVYSTTAGDAVVDLRGYFVT
jgi:hypothetical protein